MRWSPNRFAPSPPSSPSPRPLLALSLLLPPWLAFDYDPHPAPLLRCRYHAWAPWGRIETYYRRSCGWAEENTDIEREVKLPVVAGEWSLAMDTCAMWLYACPRELERPPLVP